MIQFLIYQKGNMQGTFPPPLALISRRHFLWKPLYQGHWVTSSNLWCKRQKLFFIQMSSTMWCKRWDFFSPMCWRHNIKSYLNDGISAGSWNNIAKVHCFLMIYLSRGSSKNLEKWMAYADTFLMPPECLCQVLQWAISRLNSGKYWKESDGLCADETQIFHLS